MRLSSYLISSHLISPHPTSPHPTSPHTFLKDTPLVNYGARNFSPCDRNVFSYIHHSDLRYISIVSAVTTSPMQFVHNLCVTLVHLENRLRYYLLPQQLV
jgi:hypothetical protein